MVVSQVGRGIPNSREHHLGFDGKWVGLGTIRRAEEEAGDEIVESGGLLGGVTAWHLRKLCDPGWEGGGGYTPEQVGRMTLDQIWFRLCDIKLLKEETGERTEKMGSDVAAGSIKADKDGFIKGRAADGTPIKAKIGGKSLARRMLEEHQEKENKRRAKQKKSK